MRKKLAGRWNFHEIKPKKRMSQKYYLAIGMEGQRAWLHSSTGMSTCHTRYHLSLIKIEGFCVLIWACVPGPALHDLQGESQRCPQLLCVTWYHLHCHEREAALHQPEWILKGLRHLRRWFTLPPLTAGRWFGSSAVLPSLPSSPEGRRPKGWEVLSNVLPCRCSHCCSRLSF